MNGAQALFKALTDAVLDSISCDTIIRREFLAASAAVGVTIMVPGCPGPALEDEIVRRFRRGYRQPTCGFESFLASFAFQSICSQNSFRLGG